MPSKTRFEPIGSSFGKVFGLPFQRFFWFINFFLGEIFFPLNRRVEKRHEKFLQAKIQLFKLRALLCNQALGRLGGLLFLLFNQLNHVVRPIHLQRMQFWEHQNFRIKGFFTPESEAFQKGNANAD